MMKSGNGTIKIKALLKAHPNHREFVGKDHLERYDRSIKTNVPITVIKKQKVISAEEMNQRAEKNKIKKAKRLEKERLAKAKVDLNTSCKTSTIPSSVPAIPIVSIIPSQGCVRPCRSSAMIPIDIPRMVIA